MKHYIVHYTVYRKSGNYICYDRVAATDAERARLHIIHNPPFSDYERLVFHSVDIDSL